MLFLQIMVLHFAFVRQPAIVPKKEWMKTIECVDSSSSYNREQRRALKSLNRR